MIMQTMHDYDDTSCTNYDDIRMTLVKQLFPFDEVIQTLPFWNSMIFKLVRS